MAIDRSRPLMLTKEEKKAKALTESIKRRKDQKIKMKKDKLKAKRKAAKTLPEILPETEPEIQPTPQKYTPKPQPKTLAAIQMVEAGLTPREALQVVNVKNNISDQAVSKFRKKYRLYSLAKPGMVRSAHQQIKRILAAEPREVEQQKVTKDGQVIDYKEIIAPTDANILAAASMVYDRYEPAIQHQQSVNLDISTNLIDLSRWSNKNLAREVHSVETLKNVTP